MCEANCSIGTIGERHTVSLHKHHVSAMTKIARQELSNIIVTLIEEARIWGCAEYPMVSTREKTKLDKVCSDVFRRWTLYTWRQQSPEKGGATLLHRPVNDSLS